LTFARRVQLGLRLLSSFHFLFRDRLLLINRSTVLSDNLREQNRQLCLLLSENIKIFEEIIVLWKQPTLDNITMLLKLESLKLNFQALTKCHIDSLREESSPTDFPNETKLINSNLSKNFEGFGQYFIKLIQQCVTSIKASSFDDPENLKAFFFLIQSLKTHITNIFSCIEAKIAKEENPHVLPSMKECNSNLLLTLSKLDSKNAILLNELSKYVKILSTKPEPLPAEDRNQFENEIERWKLECSKLGKNLENEKKYERKFEIK